MKALLYFIFLSVNIFGQTGPGGVESKNGSSDLRWWYDANNESYSDGDSVTSMSDLSGYGNTISASGSEKPIFVSSSSDINNLSYIQFDNDDELESSYKGNSKETMSYVAVIYHTKTNSYVRVAVQQGGRNTLAAKSGKFFDYVGAANHTSSTTSNGVWLIHTKTFAGGTVGSTITNGIKYYINGSLTDNFNYKIENRSSNTWIGGNGSGGGTGLNGNIAEIMKFTKLLNSAEQIIIENYLSAKYDIALSSNDKYAGDDGSNGDYDLSVIGVGTESDGSHTKSDDESGLVISQYSGFDNGDYLLAGHAIKFNSINNTDINGVPNLEARWERIWYFDITDAGTAMKVDVSFDFSKADITASPGTASNYKLLYRSGQSGNWSDAAPGITPTISGNQVIFNAIELTNGDGYYTLGSTDTTNSPLPIQLISFNIEKQNSSVFLTWKTLTEINNDFFTVEHSIDAIHWQKIAQIKGAGNSNVVNTYSCFDYDPSPGLNYYRLKQTDFDNKYSYSEIRVLSFTNYPQDLIIYPNPTKDYIIVKNAINKKIQIINSAGQILKERFCKVPNYKINIHDLKKGTYFIIVNTKRIKFIKI